MVQQTILTCDRCNKVVEQLFKVSARVQSMDTYHHCWDLLTQEWCRPCIVEMKLWRDHESKPAEPTPTRGELLEALIKEISEEER